MPVGELLYCAESYGIIVRERRSPISMSDARPNIPPSRLDATPIILLYKGWFFFANSSSMFTNIERIFLDIGKQDFIYL